MKSMKLGIQKATAQRFSTTAYSQNPREYESNNQTSGIRGTLGEMSA